MISSFSRLKITCTRSPESETLLFSLPFSDLILVKICPWVEAAFVLWVTDIYTLKKAQLFYLFS